VRKKLAGAYADGAEYLPIIRGPPENKESERPRPLEEGREETTTWTESRTELFNRAAIRATVHQEAQVRTILGFAGRQLARLNGHVKT